MKLKILLISKNKKILYDKCNIATFKTENGEMGIMANHAPIVARIIKSKIKIKQENKNYDFKINSGLAFMNNNILKIIVFSFD
ncbi:MAG: hypothetical protein LBJ93_02650 [Clostridiales bacterium]|jgi:F-type H+-transporting ATPase subunit epsilon|nr:hypothetical protein [Clostridiales bacterium]